MEEFHWGPQTATFFVLCLFNVLYRDPIAMYRNFIGRMNGLYTFYWQFIGQYTNSECALKSLLWGTIECIQAIHAPYEIPIH